MINILFDLFLFLFMIIGIVLVLMLIVVFVFWCGLVGWWLCVLVVMCLIVVLFNFVV